MKPKWFLGILAVILVASGVSTRLALSKADTGLSAEIGQQTIPTSEKIEAGLLAQFETNATPDYIVQFNEQADLSRAYSLNWAERGVYVYDTLRETAEQSQANAKGLLAARGIRHQTFIAGNELYVWGSNLDAAYSIAALPEVKAIRETRLYHIDPVATQSSGPLEVAGMGNLTALSQVASTDAEIQALAWGISYTRADDFWSTFGFQGEGIKVAGIDTGVQWDHPALDQSFACPGDPTNPACWSDPSNICGAGGACDNNGHGTHTMGTMVGDDDPTLTWQAGMAPGATWIACKGCESNSCSDYALNTCADWVLAPGGNPANRPHIVNNSWGGYGCDDWYLPKVNAWRAAGIFPAFSAGNTGPGCATLGSPGDYQESFATAAHNSVGTIASFSSCGPSCFGHDPYTKPNISAPGVSVCSAIPTDGWSCGYSGTSMATPHTAGAVALLWSCNPSLVGDIGSTFELLQDTAAAAPDGACGAPPDGEGNYTYGYGYLDVYNAGLQACNFTPDVLLVDDDDNDPEVRAYYEDALNTLGLRYDVWDTNNTDVEPDASYLEDYKTVIWFTGDEFGGAAGPGSAGENALATWLSGASSIVSDWNLSYDWGCIGSPGTTTITFNPDGTFATGDGGLGSWTQYGPVIQWVYSIGTTYDGTLTNNSMEGTMIAPDGITTGCWTAERIVTTGTITALSGERDSSGQLSENPGVAVDIFISPEQEGRNASYVPPQISGNSATSLGDIAESTPNSPASELNSGTNQLDFILDQQPNQANGYFTDISCYICGRAQVLAENFTLSQPESIVQVNFWSGFFPTDVPVEPDAITVIFHQDSAGLPGPVVFSESNVSYTRSQTGVILYGVHEYQHTLTFASPVDLTPGNYWVEIFNDTGFGTDDFFWEVGNPDTVGNGLPGSAVAFEAPGSTWYSQSDELSIQLVSDSSQRCLLLSSQDYMYDRGLTPFMQDYLGVGSFTSDVYQTAINGMGSVYSGLGGSSLSYPFSNFSDAVNPDSTAEVAFLGNQGNAAVNKFGNGYFTTFLGYPYEAISSTAYRQELLVAFLGACGDLPSAPDIDVSPGSLTSSQQADTIVSETFTVANLGGMALEWAIEEENTTAIYPYHPRETNILTDNWLSKDGNFIAQVQTDQMRRINANPLMLVNDGSFENGPPPASAWTEWSSTSSEWIGDWSAVWGVPAFDGVLDYWAGGYYSGVPTTSYVRQDLAVPVSDSTLSFWYLAYRPDVDDVDPDYAYVSVNGSIVWQLDMLQANNTYPDFANATVDLTAWAGQTVTLEFGGVSTGTNTGNVRFDYIEWGVPEICSAPQDVPWLSTDPLNGTILGGGFSNVEVSFDSTGLAPGSYVANLCVTSNDPDPGPGNGTDLVVVPVELVVEPPIPVPDMTVDLLELSAELLTGTTNTQTMNICNVGEAALEWEFNELEFIPTIAPLSPTVRLSTPVVLSASSRGTSSKATYPIATDFAVSLVLDDGSVENDIGISGTWEFIFLNRFTPEPVEYPFTLNEVQVYFDEGGFAQVGDDIIIVVYENVSGSYDPATGSNWLYSYPTTVQAINAWNSYDLPDPVLLSGPGDVLIGVIALETPGTGYWPAAIDQTASQQRSWAGWWTTSPPPNPPNLPPDDTWTIIDAYFPGNWMIRGYGENSTQPPVDIPWLSEDPISGTVSPGECQAVEVTFDATGMLPGDYFANLMVISNDPDPHPVLPVSMKVIAIAYGVELEPEEDALFGEPGNTVEYTLTLTNTGNVTDTFEITTAGVVWGVNLSTNSVTLDPTEDVEIYAQVSIPASAKDGDFDAITVTATSTGDPGKAALVSLTTTAVVPASYGVELEPEEDALSGAPGNTVEYTLSLTNTGNVTDTFEITTAGVVWGVLLSENSVTLNSGESVEVYVQVSIPASAKDGDFDAITVTATSTSDPGEAASVSLTTMAVVEDFKIYLPAVMKK